MHAFEPVPQIWTFSRRRLGAFSILERCLWIRPLHPCWEVVSFLSDVSGPGLDIWEGCPTLGSDRTSHTVQSSMRCLFRFGQIRGGDSTGSLPWLGPKLRLFQCARLKWCLICMYVAPSQPSLVFNLSLIFFFFLIVWPIRSITGSEGFDIEHWRFRFNGVCIKFSHPAIQFFNLSYSVRHWILWGGFWSFFSGSFLLLIIVR